MAEQTSQHPALDASLDIASAEATLYLRPDQAGNVIDFDLVYKRLQNAAAELLSANLAATDSSDVKGTTGSTQARCPTPHVGYHAHVMVLAVSQAEPRHATGHFPQGAWKFHDPAIVPTASAAPPAAPCEDAALPAPSPASLAKEGFVKLQLSRLAWAWQEADISSQSCQKALAQLYHQEQKHRAACEVLNDKVARLEEQQRPHVAWNAGMEVVELKASLAACQEALASSRESAAQIEQLGVALQQAKKEAAKLQAEKLADQHVTVDQEVELRQQRARAEQAEARLRAVEAASQSKLFRWLGSMAGGSGGSTSTSNTNPSSASNGQGAGNQGSSKGEQGKQAQGPVQPHPSPAPAPLQYRYNEVVRKLVALRAIAAVREPACQAAEAEVLRLQQALAAAEARTLLQVECGREQRLLLEAELQVLRAKAAQAEAQLQQLAAMKQPPAHRQGCGSPPCPSTGRTSPCSGSLSGCSDDGLDICSEWGSDEDRNLFKGRDQAPSPMQGVVQQLKHTLVVVAST